MKKSILAIALGLATLPLTFAQTTPQTPPTQPTNPPSKDTTPKKKNTKKSKKQKKTDGTGANQSK